MSGWARDAPESRGGGRIRSLPSGPDPGLLSEREVAAGQPLAIALLLVSHPILPSE